MIVHRIPASFYLRRSGAHNSSLISRLLFIMWAEGESCSIEKLVTEFAEYRALKNKIEKWVKALSEDFIEKFKAGYLCPADGPYLLMLGGQDRKAIDWREQFFLHRKSDYQAAGRPAEIAEQMAVDEMVKLEEDAGKNHIDQVDVKVNPGYTGKLLAPLLKKLDTRAPRGF